MSPRPAPRRRPWTQSFKPWTEVLREFFSLAPDDWTPPDYVKIRLNAKRDHLVVEGRFTQPDGTRARLTTHTHRQGEDWFVGEQKIDIRLTWRPEVVG